MYAVEQMLHGNTLEFVKSKTHYIGPYPRKIVYADGRGFDLDTAEETNCILDNRILCHFHNPNFPQFADNLHHDMHLIEAAQYDNQKITKTLDSLLPEKYISCVQQLLKDGEGKVAGIERLFSIRICIYRNNPISVQSSKGIGSRYIS